MINQLSEQLYGWLCSVHFSGWHVQIIHEYNTALAQWRTKHTLAPLIQLGHYQVLHCISVCVCVGGGARVKHTQ